jgi:hypothetical protein
MAGTAPEEGTHLEIPIHTPSGLIFETGLEFLRIYKETGLGVYYRPGDNTGNPFDYRWMMKLRVGI